jgi:hypothetical protein
VNKWLLSGLLLASVSSAYAADEAGTVKTVQGTAQIERGSEKLPLAPGARVLVSDRVVTGKESAVGITLRDNTLLTAGPNSTLQLNKFVFDTTTNAGAIDTSVKRGTLSVVSGKIAKASPDNVVFKTASTTLGVRGTEFIIEVGQEAE